MKVVNVRDRRFPSVYKDVVQRAIPSDAGHLTRTVRKILNGVQRGGDAALRRYTLRFDRFKPSQFQVSREEIERAYTLADPAVIESLRYAARRIAAFHEKQRAPDWSIEKDGVYLAQRTHPIERVGLYVPGGTAAYPSSVLMNAIPARVAGVPHRIVCSPTPDGVINPYLLIAADLAGVSEIYRIGGAQAIAAMAYGTATVPKVDKIVGPGNRYVAEAKRQVCGVVGIDMIAGPSELLIIADAAAHPPYVASDLLSQAEHDTEAVVILLTPSQSLVEAVKREMKRQLARLPRKAIAAAALKNHGVIFVVPDLPAAVRMANEIAPEHLSLFVADPFAWLSHIRNAGSVFLGEMTPQSLGDYVAGPNHVLPTGGTARFSSPLSVDDFVKKSSVVSYTQAALRKGGGHLIRIAEMEGLPAHANTVKIRLDVA